MTFARITLESFDDEGEKPPEESADYLRGFNDALAQAQETQSAELTRAAADITARLGDMTFGFTEARTLLLDRVRPLLAQVAETVLPEIAQETFAAHLVDALAANFEAVTDQPVEISVAPGALEMLSETMPAQTGSFVLVADPEIALGQAVLRRDKTHLIIDSPALLTALQAALHGLEPSERIQSNE